MRKIRDRTKDVRM